MIFKDGSQIPGGLPNDIAGRTDGSFHSALFGGGLISATVYLNTDILSNSSKEYIAATIMHEALHAYLDSKGIAIGNAQHAEMAKKYVDTMANDLMNMFPGLIKDAAYSLAWGGLEGTYLYTHPGNIYMPAYQQGINTLYRAHTDGQGHFYGHGC